MMDGEHTLSWQLDSQRPLETRRAAVATLAAREQTRVISYCRRRGITDGDTLNDLNNEIWMHIFKYVIDGRYVDKNKPAMALVYGFARNTVKHYFSRDRRATGQQISLEDVIDDEFLATNDPFVPLEDAIDEHLFFTTLLGRLQSTIERDITRMFWQGKTAPKIAIALDLDVKTVRHALRRVALQVRELRAQ